MDLNNPQAADFSDIPGLGDVQGFENFLNGPQQPATQPEGAQPGAPTTTQPGEQLGAQAPGATAPQTGITQEQFNALVQQNAELRQYVGQFAQLQQQAQAMGQQYNTQLNQGEQMPMTPQNVAMNLARRGYNYQQISQALNAAFNPDGTPKAGAQNQGGVQNAQFNLLAQELAKVQEQMYQQQYQKEYQEFENKLTSFGNRFGLSEQDLVTFGEEAFRKGINLTQVTDVEAVFRAIYPQQYSVRLQRMSPTPSQIYSGQGFAEAPSNINAKNVDAAVEAFLKGAMPNAYIPKK